MRFADVENIWADLNGLSMADRGRVYFERAKQVVTEALNDPTLRARAVAGTQFRRDYLVDRIGCQPAVTSQNPHIRKLLSDTDLKLGREAERQASDRRRPGTEAPEVTKLKATVDVLRRRIEVQDAEIADLRRQLREAGWSEVDLAAHGRLPW